MRQATYEIRLRSEPPPDLLAGLKGATHVEAGGETVLLTLDIDQTRLHLLVTRLRDLGIELLEIRRATPPGAPRTSEMP